VFDPNPGKIEIIEGEVKQQPYPPIDERFELWQYNTRVLTWKYLYDVPDRATLIAVLKAGREPYLRGVHFTLV